MPLLALACASTNTAVDREVPEMRGRMKGTIRAGMASEAAYIIPLTRLRADRRQRVERTEGAAGRVGGDDKLRETTNS